MESQEPSGASDAPKPFPKAPLKKKSLFSKRIPANTQDPEPQEGIDFFSRAKDFFPTQVIEQGRRRQEKQDAEERARSRSTKSSEKESTARESKRRRISQHEDEDEDEAMSGGSREASLGARYIGYYECYKRTDDTVIRYTPLKEAKNHHLRRTLLQSPSYNDTPTRYRNLLPQNILAKDMLHLTIVVEMKRMKITRA